MKCFEYGNKNAPIVLLQPVDDHDLDTVENEIAIIWDNTAEDFRMAAFKVYKQ